MFIVGADITEFGDAFKQSEEEIAAWALQANQVFNAFEDLPVPTLVAINGIALGGGFEMCSTPTCVLCLTKPKSVCQKVKLGLNAWLWWYWVRLRLALSVPTTPSSGSAWAAKTKLKKP